MDISRSIRLGGHAIQCTLTEYIPSFSPTVPPIPDGAGPILEESDCAWSTLPFEMEGGMEGDLSSLRLEFGCQGKAAAGGGGGGSITTIIISMVSLGLLPVAQPINQAHQHFCSQEIILPVWVGVLGVSVSCCCYRDVRLGRDTLSNFTHCIDLLFS